MIRLAIPSKGRMMEETVDWFGARGVTLVRPASGREYTGSVREVDGVALVPLPAGEIPGELAAGRAHLGVTGSDLAGERLGRGEAKAMALAGLGFGKADLLIAVPDFWTDVETLDDLDEVAGEFRAAHGHRLRIATKYHRTVREFLRAREVADYLLVDSQGATEGAVRNLAAEAIADITTTGATLEANHLRPLRDGTVHRSQATLFRSASAAADGRQARALEALMSKLGL